MHCSTQHTAHWTLTPQDNNDNIKPAGDPPALVEDEPEDIYDFTDEEEELDPFLPLPRFTKPWLSPARGTWHMVGDSTNKSWQYISTAGHI
jgi:hypothetical protein